MTPSEPDEPELLRKRPVPPTDPDLLRKPAAGPPPGEPDVGQFRQGTALSQLALGRYLVGRALAESVGTSLLLLAVGLLALAALGQWVVHSTLLAVLLVLVALFVLVLRWLLLAVLRRLTGFAQYEPVETRMRKLVADTRADVLRELRRLGLPGRTVTLPVLAIRLLRPTRRADTLARLRGFETARVVPKARLDELHLLLRQAVGGGVPPARR
jgi:hypothetical protein